MDLRSVNDRYEAQAIDAKAKRVPSTTAPASGASTKVIADEGCQFNGDQRESPADDDSCRVESVHSACNEKCHFSKTQCEDPLVLLPDHG